MGPTGDCQRADARAGFKIAAADIAHRFAAVDEHGAPPFSADVGLVLQAVASLEHRSTTVIILGAMVVFIAADTAVAPGEAQVRRDLVEVAGFNPAEVAAHHKAVFVIQRADQTFCA